MGVLFSGVMNDPAYKQGEEYVLFLREGPEVSVGGGKTKTQAIVSPEGRFRVDNGETLTAMSPRDFAKGLNGSKASELTERAKNASGNRLRDPAITRRPNREE